MSSSSTSYSKSNESFQGFGQNHDLVTREILLNIERDADLIKAIATSRTAKEITDQDSFWRDRLIMKFPDMAQFKDRLNLSHRDYYVILSLVSQFTLTDQNAILIYRSRQSDESEDEHDPKNELEESFVYIPTIKRTDDLAWTEETEDDYPQLKGVIIDPWNYFDVTVGLSKEWMNATTSIANRLADHLAKVHSTINRDFFFSEFFLTKLMLKGRHCRCTDAICFFKIVKRYLEHFPNEIDYILEKCNHEEQSSGLFTYLDDLFTTNEEYEQRKIHEREHFAAITAEYQMMNEEDEDADE